MGDKLHRWPEINLKGGRTKITFLDFLKDLQSREAAMPHIKTLEILNESNESQEIFNGVTGLLVSMRTNGDHTHHSNFLLKEVDLTYNPTSSI